MPISEEYIDYKTIASISEGEYKDKGSKFLAFAFPVSSEDEVLNKIQELRQKHKGARHFCYAYILNHDKSVWRANDDGEPSGSAGLPIYNQCLSYDLTNILVVVVRYFGGTKLGIPGLIKAYKEATIDAMQNAKLIVLEPTTEIEFMFSYEQMNDVMSLVKKFKTTIIEKQFGNTNSLKLSVSVNICHQFKQMLENINIQIKT